MISLDQVEANVDAVVTRIRNAADQPVKVLVATKMQAPAQIATAVAALNRAAQQSENRIQAVLVGENRVQELVEKQDSLAHLPGSPPVHFIGRLQKNKINQLLGTPVIGVQTIADLDMAQALSERAVRAGRETQVMLQVNVSGESQKGGCAPSSSLELAKHIASLPVLTLAGFMCIGARPLMPDGDITNAAQILHGYQQLRQIRDEVLSSRAPNTEQAQDLSMGMSTDFELALAAGATMIRLGTAIFGPRPVLAAN